MTSSGKKKKIHSYLPLKYISFTAGTAVERGYFGPWRTCKILLYNRERCGQNVSRFQPVCKFQYYFECFIHNVEINSNES